MNLARRVHAQECGERGPKIYSLHAPEVECIGKGKPHKPYEFGVKVSVATPLHRCAGGQFVAHVAALPGNPYDGHTAPALPRCLAAAAPAASGVTPASAIPSEKRGYRTGSCGWVADSPSGAKTPQVKPTDQ